MGRGPITYPTGKSFGSRKLVEAGTSFYVGNKRLVKFVSVGTSDVRVAIHIKIANPYQYCKPILKCKPVL